VLRIVAIVTVCVALGCAHHPRPSMPVPDPRALKLATLQDQTAALDARIGALERASREQSPPPPRWSCSARCGHQSTQTTAFKIIFRYVVGEGRSAAQAYKQLVDACDDGRLYESMDGERFVGGDMRSSCLEGH
jgi:hypothetical protein